MSKGNPQKSIAVLELELHQGQCRVSKMHLISIRYHLDTNSQEIDTRNWTNRYHYTGLAIHTHKPVPGWYWKLRA